MTRSSANRVRLMPIVVVAMLGLLGLKLLGMMLDGGYVVPPPQTASVAQQPEKAEKSLPQNIARVFGGRRGQPAEEPEVTGSVDKKKDEKAAEPAKAAEAPAEDGPGSQRFAPPETDPRLSGGGTPSEAERKVLERLRQRRSDLESRDQELEMRESLLRATERKLDQRINELRTLEGKLDVGETAKKEKASEQLKSLVVMYEAMKPKDAARVFDRLDLPVLIDLVTQMNPRKTSEILASMSSEAAQRLTVALARRAKGEEAAARETAQAAPAGSLLPASELQRIDSPTPRP